MQEKISKLYSNMGSIWYQGLELPLILISVEIRINLLWAPKDF